MNTVNILFPVRYPGKIHAVSSSFETNEAKNVLNNDGSFWCTAKSHNAVSEYIIIDYGSIVAVNIIEIYPSPSGKTTFPSEFRLECSIDGISWEVIKTENRFILDEDAYRLLLPMTVFQYLKLYIVKPKRIAAKYFAEIGKIQAGIQGAASITASSSSSYEHDPSNVIEINNQKYWESEITSNASRQWIEVDFGMIFSLTNIGIVAPQNPALFPEQFSIEITEDKKIWTTLADVKRFKAQPNGSYIFGGYQFNARYIRFNVLTVQTEKQKYCAQIAGIFAHAALPALRHFHINAAVQYATVFQPGIVKLAADGDTTPGTVVQANDTRLRDASTIFKGIVQLAVDGANQEGLAVQASDSRLAPATELKPGIVRLAYDREVAEGAVVQSTDSRIREATDTTFGIVKLCPNGQYISNAVVRGDDSRIQKATTKSFGIVRLAENGEDNEFCVVQGNDKRLKDATIVSKGIVELAEDGEDAPNVVVQGNDKRLKEATTKSKGIVELAEDGEDAPNVVVQGNDRRLKEATTHSKGIVELAEDGEDAPNVVVQGNDKRLKEA
ncbi:MAG: discoidin domain-containing protein, partial [Spirochaetota bacterium]